MEEMGRPVRTDGARHHYDGVECTGGWRSHGRMSRLFVRATCTGCGHGFHMEVKESSGDRSKRPSRPRHPISWPGPRGRNTMLDTLRSTYSSGGGCSSCGADRWLQPEWSEGYRRLRALLAQSHIMLECGECENRQLHWYWRPGPASERVNLEMRPCAMST